MNDRCSGEVFLSSNECSGASGAGAEGLCQVGTTAIEVARCIGCGVGGVKDGSVFIDDERQFAIEHAHIVDAEREILSELLLNTEVDLVVGRPTESLLQEGQRGGSNVPWIGLAVEVRER